METLPGGDGNIMGKLHTKASYWLLKDDKFNPDFSYLKIERHEDKITKQILDLTNKENQFYRKVIGANNFEDFKRKVWDLLDDDIIEVLRRFSNFDSQLTQVLLNSYTKSMPKILTTASLELEIHMDKIEDIKLKKIIEKDSTLNLNHSRITNNPTFLLGLDIKELKNLMHSLNIDISYIKNEKHLFNKIRKELVDRDIITFANVSSNKMVKKDFVGYVEDSRAVVLKGKYPWGINISILKQIYERANKYEKEIIKNEVNEITLAAKNAILNFFCAGSGKKVAKFRNIMEDILNTKLKDFEFGTILTSTSVGGNFLNGMIGALGEFQWAAFSKFIGGENIFTQVVGDDLLNNGAQRKSDVDIYLGEKAGKIFPKLGVQVKNYKSTTKNMAMAQNPEKMAQYIYGSTDAQGAQEFLTFLANYFFNTTFQNDKKNTFEELQEFLSNYYGELANLDINSDIEDAVVFYWIGGKYLIPGSYILSLTLDTNWFSKKGTAFKNKKIKISGEKPKGDDNYFAQYVDGVKRYEEYWKNGKTPTSENFSYYNHLIRNKISIRTDFHYTTAMKNQGARWEQYNLLSPLIMPLPSWSR